MSTESRNLFAQIEEATNHELTGPNTELNKKICQYINSKIELYYIQSAPKKPSSSSNQDS